MLPTHRSLVHTTYESSSGLVHSLQQTVVKSRTCLFQFASAEELDRGQFDTHQFQEPRRNFGSIPRTCSTVLAHH